MKPNFDTHAAYSSLVNSGLDPKQAEQILETLKDSQQDLVTKDDLKATESELKGEMAAMKSDLKAAADLLSLQIKALFVMDAGIIAAIAWFGNAFLDKLP